MAYRQILKKLYFCKDLNPPQNMTTIDKDPHNEMFVLRTKLIWSSSLCLLGPIHLHMA